MVARERETVDLADVIRDILDNYPAGSAVLREFLQNSDDSGARRQEFILDPRSFPKVSLVAPALAHCQGPALFATNDGHVREKDWKAFKHIHSSSKTADETSTGKYGLGFRSCYHVTDNPHILSDKKLLVLDPHGDVQNYQGGFSLTLDTNDRHQYHDHFLAFQSVLSQDDQIYDGTAIRLPLRLDAQANRSRIKSEATSVESIRTMFWDFVKKELHEALLFLKNITSIGLFEIGDNGDKKQIASAWIDNADEVATCRGVSRGRTEESSTYELCIKVEVRNPISGRSSISSRSWILTQFVENYGRVDDIVTSLCPDGLPDLMASEKLLPHVALAYPVPDTPTSSLQDQGKLFTLLPLPIVTGFPLHIHAIFALTRNRQSLRNPRDVAAGSREEILVRWNKAIFRNFIPKAWEKLFENAVQGIGTLAISPYDLWPKAGGGDQDYWKDLPQELLKRVAPKQIWPLLSEGDASAEYRSLKDVLLASTNAEPELLSILADCGVLISQPPEHVYSLVESSEANRSRLMTPSSVVDAVESNASSLSDLPPTTRSALCDYISTGNDINLLSRVSLIPCADGTWTPINPQTSYTLATEVEAHMFDGIDSRTRFLALDQIGETAKDLLLSSPDIKLLKQADVVVRLLARKYSRFQSSDASPATVSADVEAADVDWLVEFWNWIGDWREASDIWAAVYRDRFKDLHIIPLSIGDGRHGLRILAEGSIDPVGLDAELLEVFRELRLPILDSRIKSPRSSLLQRGLKPPSNLLYLLSALSGLHSYTLSPSNCSRLHNHFVNHNLQRQLNHDEMATLRLLPIYPILRAGVRTPSGYAFEAGPVSPCFVDDSLEVVPILPGRPIVAFSQCRTMIPVAYGSEVEVAQESQVLELAVQCWEDQDQELAPRLVARIISRLEDLSADTLRLVERLPIVDVGLGPTSLRRPIDTVDPNSSIAQLFDDGEGFLPRGLFASDGSYLRQLRNRGMLLDQLSPEVVIERIRRIVDPITPLPGKHTKAKVLLQFLDNYRKANALPDEAVHAITTQPWLPARDKYYLASECWDERPSDLSLCDRILPLVNYVVESPRLRETLGWRRLPFDVLQRQFLAVVQDVAAPAGPRVECINALINTLAHRLSNGFCTENELRSLGQALGERPWVPVTSDHSLPLHRTALQPIDLGPRIQQVLPSLLTDPLVTRLFRLIGVPRRPSYELLYTELAEISLQLRQHDLQEPERTGLVSTSLKVICELFQRNPSDSTKLLDRSRIQVPTAQSLLHPIDSTFFNDMGSDYSSDDRIVLAHPSIGWGLAKTIGLLRLSDKRFDAEDDLLRGRQQREGFHARILGVLKDSQIESASTEWVANADNSGATKVGFMVDDATFGRSPSSWFLTPQSAELCQSPALVIWNNGSFTEKDYESLLSSGRGEQGAGHEVMGRFGLGALSFYHFTEMIMLVSGNRVMFLDPSGSHLPRDTRGDQRTALIVSLDTCRNKYPGHLQQLEGLFGFSRAMENYKGTIFRLPLRTLQQALESKISNRSFDTVELHTLMETKFFDQAKGSLFFSHVEEISAHRRDTLPTPSPIWSIRSTKQRPAEAVGGYHLEMGLEISFEAQSEMQEWLIHFAKIQHSDVPGMFSHLMRSHRLPPPSIGLAMRINHDVPTTTPARSQIFATLPLPVEITLPVHVHATWILTEDRRTIRFDARDSDGECPMDTRYNLYLLKDLIPEVYLRMLATLARRDPQAWSKCWPGTTEEVLQPMVTTFYERIAQTIHRVCLTVTGDAVTPAAAIFATSTSLHVRAILKALQLPDLVSPLPFGVALMPSWKGLRIDDVKTVTRLLRLNTPAVMQLLRPESPQPLIVSEHLDGMIRYLAEGEEGLNGLPLLQLGDGDITTFGDATHPWIFQDAVYSFGESRDVSISTLFGARHIVGSAITDETCELLIGKVGNVRNLDVTGIRQLLAPLTPLNEATVTVDRKEWLLDLLRFLDSCSTVKLEDIADLPLIPVMNGNTAISLNKARDGTVFDVASLRNLYLPIMHLGVLVISSVPGVTLEPVLDLTRLLQAFRSLGLDVGILNQRVSAQEWESLRQWIRDSLRSSRWNDVDRQTLLTLLIFEAQSGGQASIPSLHPARETRMLPTGVRLASVVRYLPSSVYFSDHSIELRLVLEGRREQMLSPEDLVNRLELPTVISPDEDHYFQHALKFIISQQRWGVVPFVPDMDRILRRPEELYDHRVRPFVVAFGTRPAMFVHPGYRDKIDSLAQAGVRRVIDAPSLIQCATALDEDARRGALDPVRAAEFWMAFANDNANRNISLNTIARLRFIPYPPERRGVVEFEDFARSLPDRKIASPDELVRVEFEPVVWTQRARFSRTTPDFIFTINRRLGVPTVVEVVNHLEVLTTKIAPKFPSHPSLLDDLTKTYDWLLDHIEDAGMLLEQRKNSFLWLNVNDPKDRATNWTWRSGIQLIFDLGFDDPNGDHYGVKRFLVGYSDLIKAAGAEKQTLLEVRAVESEMTHGERLCRELESLRQENLMTSVQFEVDGEIVNAHRGVLAAAIPHLRRRLAAPSQGAEVAISVESPIVFPTDGISSAFAVRSVIDYAYRGSFARPLCNTVEEAATALHDLLALLELSDMWKIEVLKRQTEKAIVELNLVRRETHEYIRRRAVLCQATALAEACCQRKQEVNRWASAQGF